MNFSQKVYTLLQCIAYMPSTPFYYIQQAEITSLVSSEWYIIECEETQNL